MSILKTEVYRLPGDAWRMLLELGFVLCAAKQLAQLLPLWRASFRRYREELAPLTRKQRGQAVTRTAFLAYELLWSSVGLIFQLAVILLWVVIAFTSSQHSVQASYAVYADLYAPANWLKLADGGAGLRSFAAAVDTLFTLAWEWNFYFFVCSIYLFVLIGQLIGVMEFHPVCVNPTQVYVYPSQACVKP